MTKYVIIDGEGNEHTDPVSSETEARSLLNQAKTEGTLNYSIKRIDRGFM